MSEEEDIGQLDITDEMIAEGRSYTGVMPDDMPKMMARTILENMERSKPLVHALDLNCNFIGNFKF